MRYIKLRLTYLLTYYVHCVSEKTRKLWNGIARNHMDRFSWHLAQIFKRLQNWACVFQFSCRFAFLSTFRLSNRTPKISRILTLYQGNAPTLTRCNFFKHIPQFIIFGTHNLQTFKHNALINELLVMQFYLFNIRPKLHHHKGRKLRRTAVRLHI